MSLANRLESITKKHNDLELAIHDLEQHPLPDETAIRRLKVEKLALKDEISEINSQLVDMAAE